MPPACVSDIVDDILANLRFSLTMLFSDFIREKGKHYQQSHIEMPGLILSAHFCHLISICL